MARIPLEDNYTDIIAKAQRGMKISDAELAKRAEVEVAAVEALKAGQVTDAVLRRVARHLRLGPIIPRYGCSRTGSPSSTPRSKTCG